MAMVAAASFHTMTAMACGDSVRPSKSIAGVVESLNMRGGGERSLYFEYNVLYFEHNAVCKRKGASSMLEKHFTKNTKVPACLLAPFDRQTFGLPHNKSKNQNARHRSSACHHCVFSLIFIDT